ncbi:hypothetical protein DVH24_027223 [Malus domestica]|uniref:Uncharacterized protein n=1 Tax=Malus domestica TaxID=3750 RepID=A0A498IQ38_MALDO|nr:hypothetical protein DVH24_027223 [Malus domestica]
MLIVKIRVMPHLNSFVPRSDIEEWCKASDVEKTRAATAVNNILSGVNGHISLWEEIQLIRADDKNILYILSLYCAQHTEQGALYRILLRSYC